MEIKDFTKYSTKVLNHDIIIGKKKTKTELVASLMHQDQSQFLLFQPHSLKPDIYHMCGFSGKTNSIWEYMVRKFIAHVYDKPSGTGIEVEGRSLKLPAPPVLVSIRLGNAGSQTVQGGLV